KLAGQLSLLLPERELQRRLAASPDNVHDGFRLYKVNTSVQKRSFRKFTGLSGSRSCFISQGQNLLQGPETAMSLKFHNVFRRIGMRRTHEDGKHFVNRRAFRV